MHKFIKKRPFIEIIDFNKELKEYKFLCKRKSKKFIYYLDWEKYIISLLNKIKNDDEWQNFKYFCRNRERSTKNMPSIYLSLIILFSTIYIDNFVKNINLLGWILIFTITIAIIVWQNNDYEKENYFYKDVLEIIEKEEHKKNISLDIKNPL